MDNERPIVNFFFSPLSALHSPPILFITLCFFLRNIPFPFPVDSAFLYEASVPFPLTDSTRALTLALLFITLHTSGIMTSPAEGT